MFRRRLVPLVSTTACLCLLFGGALLFISCGREDRAPRTVVLVVVDTLRADALGCTSDRRWPTPAIDALAANSTLYTRAYASAGWTLPSVASLFTSYDPEVHHAFGKHTLLAPLTPDVTTLAEVFLAEGYRTAAVANAAFLSPLLGLDRGFEVYDHRHAYSRTIRRADVSVTRALELAEQAAGADLFLFVHLFDPHLDYDPSHTGREQLELPTGDASDTVNLQHLRDFEAAGGPTTTELDHLRELYQAEVFDVDQAVGALVSGLKELDRWSNCTFAFTSDHGEEFFEHGGVEHGHSLHTELVHVPLIVRTGPATSSSTPRRCDGVVSTRDLGRRLLELEGLEAADFADSHSDWVGTGGGEAYSATTLYGPDRIALRTQTHALLLELRKDSPVRPQLYDLKHDPDERTDIAQQANATFDELRTRLNTRRRSALLAGLQTERLEWQDLGPTQTKDMDATQRSLESLGYTGSDRDQ